jgi:hypothetical protein
LKFILIIKLSLFLFLFLMKIFFLYFKRHHHSKCTKKILVIYKNNKRPLIGNPHRQHTFSSIIVILLTGRWNIDVFGLHLSTSAVRVIYLAGNLLWSPSGRDRVDINIDLSTHCMIFFERRTFKWRMLCDYTK